MLRHGPGHDLGPFHRAVVCDHPVVPIEGYQDGLLEVNILTAEKTGEFINLAWELLLDPEASKSNLHELSVRRSLRLDVEGLPMTVQGDGEVIGETPVEIQVVPKAVRVLVPKI